MKPWFPTGHLLSSTNLDRFIPSKTLYIRHNHHFFISNTCLPRCYLWMSYPISTCKWSLHIFYLPIYSCRTRLILLIPYFFRNMKHWNQLIYSHSYSIYRLSYSTTNIWRATVITNLLSAIPNISTSLIKWTWGDFSVDKVNLTQFFTFHFILPFIIAALAAVHLLFLHKTGSNNPTGISSHIDKIPFHSYHTIKGASLMA